MNTDLNYSFGLVPVRSQKDDLKEFSQIFYCLNIVRDRQDLYFKQMRDTVHEKDVVEWMNVEAHQDLREVMVEDEFEHYLEGTDTTVPETATIGSDSEENFIVTAFLPPMGDT